MELGDREAENNLGAVTEKTVGEPPRKLLLLLLFLLSLLLLLLYSPSISSSLSVCILLNISRTANLCVLQFKKAIWWHHNGHQQGLQVKTDHGLPHFDCKKMLEELILAEEC